MIALLSALTASAAPGASSGAPASVVGLPLARLDAIGLAPPTVPAVEPLSMRYPLEDGGGFVVVVVRPTGEQASAAFDGMARTLATHWPAPAPGAVLPGDRTLGDGAGTLLVQSGNAVVFVRHHEDLVGGPHPRDRAAEIASRVLGAMARDEADCAGATQLPDGRAADGCGRPLRP
jgi:hypothetical protein